MEDFLYQVPRVHIIHSVTSIIQQHEAKSIKLCSQIQETKRFNTRALVLPCISNFRAIFPQLSRTVLARYICFGECMRTKLNYKLLSQCLYTTGMERRYIYIYIYNERVHDYPYHTLCCETFSESFACVLDKHTQALGETHHL